MPSDLIGALVRIPPRGEYIGPGTQFATFVPDTGLAQPEFQEDGSLVWIAASRRAVISADEPEGWGS